MYLLYLSRSQQKLSQSPAEVVVISKQQNPPSKSQLHPVAETHHPLLEDHQQ
jgi:hypothetical protein